MITLKSLVFLVAIGALTACGSSGGGGGSKAADDAGSVADTAAPEDTTTLPGADTTTPPADEGGGGEDTTVAPPDTTTTTDTATSDTTQPPPSDDTIDGAIELLLNAGTEGDLDVTGDVDYYAFTGTKGDLVSVEIQAQETPFDKEAIDAVITLYGADKKPLAFNDDPTPRTTNDSQIITILPADGTYYVRVEECWTWVEAAAPAGGSCADPKDKTTTAYTLGAYVLDVTGDNFTADAEKGNTEAEATVVSYGKSAQGNYLLSIIHGTFANGSDVDVFEVTVPADMGGDGGGRPGADFIVMPAGTDGNGSTAKPGKVRIAKKSAPEVILAEVDPTKGELQPPITYGETYYVTVTRASVTPGTNDFYIVLHSAGDVNPPEKDEAGNDKPETAEALEGETTDGVTRFFVEGDLISDAADVDHFAIEVPAGAKTLTAVCGALTSGSGLKGLTLAVLDDTGGSIEGATGKETPDTNAFVEALAVNEATKLIVKVSASSQDAGVTGAFYRCGFSFASE